jgi:hypothetical protein
MRPLCLAAFLIAAGATDAAAQTWPPVRVNGSLQGLVSWQPVRRNIGGPPYIDRGLGGLGPGLAAGADSTIGRLALDVEYSRARIRVTQTGRLAGGTSVGTLADPLFTLLGGITFPSATRESLTFSAGISIVSAQPEQGGVPIPDWDGISRTTPSVGLTTGFRYSRDGIGRMGWTITGRYSHLPRSRAAEDLGVSAHVIRIGAGVRFRVR